VSKADENPAATTAAGPSLIPRTEQAVLLAAGRFAEWMRGELGYHLNGKQVQDAVQAAAKAFVPIVRAAAMTDLADAVLASPDVPDELGEALRTASTAALARDWGV